MESRNEGVMDSKDGNASTKDESMHPEIVAGEETPRKSVEKFVGGEETPRKSVEKFVGGEETPRKSVEKFAGGDNVVGEGPRKSSSSSSSDSSIEDDFFHLDAKNLSKPTTPLATQAENEDPIFPLLGNDLQPSPPATAEAESTALQTSPGTQDDRYETDASKPPPVQEMVRTDVPDPYRIPSSIFERTKSNAPMEWSVASNESLFSIHMGNSSFSRDQFIPLEKSEELAVSPPILPPEPETDCGSTLTPEEVNAEAMKDVLRAAADEHAEKKKPPVKNAPPIHASVSRRSSGSTGSINSFAFPILTGELRNGSVRVIPEKSDHPKKMEVNETQSVENTPKAARRSWHTCFPCSFCR